MNHEQFRHIIMACFIIGLVLCAALFNDAIGVWFNNLLQNIRW